MKIKSLLLLLLFLFPQSSQCGKGGFVPLLGATFVIGETITWGTIIKGTIIAGLFGTSVYLAKKKRAERKDRQEMLEDFERTYGGSSGGGDDDDDRRSNREKPSNSVLRDIAGLLGFSKKRDISHGQLVFQAGPKEISYDADSHCGGFWKMHQKDKRLGTYNVTLTKRIGD